LLQGPIPPSSRRVKFRYKSEFIQTCRRIQHDFYWTTDTPLILIPAAITQAFTRHVKEKRTYFDRYLNNEWPTIESFPHNSAINNALPHVTYIWSRAGCVVPIQVEFLEGIVLTFWKHGYLALLTFLGAWLRDDERRLTTDADTPDADSPLQGAGIQEIRRRLPLWPNLGPDDRIPSSIC
jgi:hypothetical protein